MLNISFTCYGKCEPQGSSRAFVPKGWTRAVITSANKNLKPYRQEVSRAALAKRHEIGFYDVMFGKHVAVGVSLKFYFNKPESVTKKRIEHVVKPDIDKICRSIFDSLTGIIFLDDSQVVSIQAEKFYGLPERVEVSVFEKVSNVPQSLFVKEVEEVF